MNFSFNRFFRDFTALNRLILVNIAVFALLKFFHTLLFLFNGDQRIYETIFLNLSVPASLSSLAMKPWTIFSYMFVHESFFHLLFNMLWLYWFGQIFTEYLGEKKLVAVYILGGLFGALVFVLAFNIFPVFGNSSSGAYAIGASAGILAVVVATATLLPEFKISLMFLGPVSLKVIAIVSILLDILSISDGNAGGHFAHLGGALSGYIFIRQLKKGNDFTGWFIKISEKIKNFFTGKSTMKVVFKKRKSDEEFNSEKRNKEQLVDSILDKIAKSGYDSLTKEEKDFLFNVSKDKN